jgi:Arc/MetJ family transcription regulator
MGAIANVKLEKAEEDVLGKMVEVGLFHSRDEAARAAIIKYASDLGILSPEILWRKISRHKRRKVTPQQLMKDLEIIEEAKELTSLKTKKEVIDLALRELINRLRRKRLLSIRHKGLWEGNLSKLRRKRIIDSPDCNRK